MPGDGILSIGATVDKTGVETGLAAIGDSTKTLVQSIAVQVEETAAKTRAAWNKLGSDVKAAASSVSAEALRVAETTKANTAALADLRRASVLAKDANIDEAESTRVLAAAQEKAAATAAAIAEAKQAQAAAIEEANLREGLSENLLVAEMQLASRKIALSFDEMKARLVLGAKGGTFQIRDLATAFTGLGEVIAAVVAAGMIIHFADDTAKAVEELGHLSVESGIAIENLSGLKEIVEEMGGEWDPVAMGVVRLQRAIKQAQAGVPTYIRAFQDIGVTMDQLNGKKAEEQLNIISAAIQRTGDVGRVADAAITLFSRDGLKAIPIFQEYGGTLSTVIDQTGKLTGVTGEAYDSARAWTQTMHRLSMEFHAVMIPALRVGEIAIAKLAASVEVLAAYLYAIGDVIMPVAKNLATLGGLIYDALTGRYRQLKNDTALLTHDLEQSWKEYADRAGSHFRDANARWAWTPPKVEAPPPAPDEGPAWLEKSPTPKDHRGAPRGQSEIGRDVDALNELKLDHAMTLEEEIDFWQKRLAAAKNGSAKYKAAITAKLAPLEQREMRKPAALAPETASPDVSDAEATTTASLQTEALAQQLAAKQEQEAARAAAEAKIRAAQDAYAEVERTTEAQVRLGQMSQQQRLAALRSAADEELKIREQQSQLIQMLDMADQRRTERDLADEEQAYRQHALQIAQIQQQQAQLMQQKSQAMVQAMTGPFDQFVDHWLTNGRFMANAFANMADGMAMNVIRSIMRMGQAQLEHAVTSLAVHTTTNQAKVASDAVAAAQSSAIETESAMKSLAKSAAKAAGKAWSALSDIPVVGPVLGAAAAAATFTGVMALAAFDQGGVVPNRMGLAGYGAHVPILAEAGERVLSGPQSTNFEKLVNQTAAPASTNVHYHDHTSLSGIDGASIAGMYRKNAAAGRREFVRQIRLANLT